MSCVSDSGRAGRKPSVLKIAVCLVVLFPALLRAAPSTGPSLSGSFSNIAAAAVINLTAEGELDWVHWGLYTETSLDRKAGVVPQISDFTLLDAPSGFAFVYWFGDNANGYTWSDGTPTAGVTNTTTGVWAYGTPQLGSGFQVTAPADTFTRTFKLYVGAYGARGQFEAYLSDGSAPGYTNNLLFNQRSGPGGFYTVTYRAASAGQQLIARWTLQIPSQPDGNVTLQAATLTATNFNNPPAVSLAGPLNNSTFSAGTTINLVANASDSDGSVAKVEFFANGTKLGEDTASPFSYSWDNVAAGSHVLTARATDAGGASSDSGPVEIFVNGTGGSLVANLAEPTALPASVNLTAEGSRDWTHWGLATNELFNHKAAVTREISDFSKIGASPVEIYGDNYTAYSWSDGTPTASANNVTIGVFTTGVTNGFEINVPADATSRTLRVYVGLYGAQGNFQAWLSDYSGPAYTDVTLSNFFGNAYGVYTLTYAAASPGQTLHVRYRSLKLFDQDFGNVTLQAATLTANTGGNTPPTVGVTSPANGAVLTAPASFTLAANASDTDGSVAQVEFFNGSTSLGIDFSDPYSVAVNNLAGGGYTLSAVATDNVGAKATNSVSVVVNALPTATLLTPTDGQSFVAPANITLTADADDADGSVANVEFYNGATLLGSDAISPYSFAWNNVAAGSYTLTVKATDNRGAVTTSAAISISVVNNLSPTVSVTSPANGAVLTAPASFTLAANASDTDGSVAQVEFFNGSTSLGIDFSDPYSVVVNSLAEGTYTLSAVATDNVGAKATNSVSVVVNALPTATLLTPTDGQSFVAPANITLTADANDADGSVTNVEFYNGATLLGSDAISPYSVAWNNVATGNYTLTVKATDNRGAVTTSAAVSISVTSAPAEPVTLLNPMWNGAAFMFSFASQAGRDYEVQTSSVPGIGAWQRLTNLVGNGAVLTVTNQNPGAGQRVYRIESK